MARYANTLSFLLVIVFLTTLKVDARATKFSRFIPQVDEQQPLKPSSETKNYNGYRFENHDSDIPPEEFVESIKKDSPESSYVTEPQGRYKEKDSNDFYYPNKGAMPMHKTDASTNDEYALTSEEREFFNKKEASKKETMNGYTGYNNNDDEDVLPAQGMSDTRTLENGKYYYNPMDVKGKRGGSEKYNNEGYNGNREYMSKSDEFLPLENFEWNPQNQGGFNP